MSIPYRVIAKPRNIAFVCICVGNVIDASSECKVRRHKFALQSSYLIFCVLVFIAYELRFVNLQMFLFCDVRCTFFGGDLVFYASRILTSEVDIVPVCGCRCPVPIRRQAICYHNAVSVVNISLTYGNLWIINIGWSQYQTLRRISNAYVMNSWSKVDIIVRHYCLTLIQCYFLCLRSCYVLFCLLCFVLFA